MNTFDALRRRELGLSSALAVERQIRYNVTQNLCLSRISSFINSQIADLQDLTLCNNKLLAAHSGFVVSLYDVSDPSQSHYPAIGTWRKDATVFSNGKECADWNSDCDFFTVSGNSNELIIVDTETLITLESIGIRGARSIYQHRCNPHDNALIAVGSTSHELSLVDIRTGSAATTLPGHKHSVKSVAWCPLEEFVLLSCDVEENLVWDIRSTKSSLSRLETCAKKMLVTPEVQFIPYSYNFVILKADGALEVWDLKNLTMTGCIDDLDLSSSSERYKFSISASSDPQILFIPSNKQVCVYSLKDYSEINTLCGHILPVKLTIFNEQHFVLYSASKDWQSVIWQPHLDDC